MFKELEKHFKDKNFVDEELMNAIKPATQAIGKAVRAVNNMKNQLKKLTDAQKKEYRKSIKDLYKDSSKEIDKILNQINNLGKANKPMTMAAMSNSDQLNYMAKYFAYFGKELQSGLDKYIQNKKAVASPFTAQEPKIEELLKKTSVPNLNDLKAKIQELKKSVDEL